MALPDRTTLRSYPGSATPAYLTSTLSGTYSPGQTLTINSSLDWYEVSVSGTSTMNPLGSSGVFTLVVDYGLATEEKILCSGAITPGTSTIVTVFYDGIDNGRGYDGTPVSVHGAGSSGDYNVFPVATAVEQLQFNQTVASAIISGTAAGGDLSGYYPDPSLSTTVSGVIYTNEANIATLSGYVSVVSGESGTNTSNIAALSGSVSSISGSLSTVSGVAYINQSNIAALSGIAIVSGYVAGGDLGGNYPNPTVTHIQGTPVSSTAPGNNQLLRYVSASGAYIPQTSTLLIPTSILISSNYVASPNDYVVCNPIASGITITLPHTPSNATVVSVANLGSSIQTTTVVPSGGDTIPGGDVLLQHGYFNSVSFVYDSNTNAWLPQINESVLAFNNQENNFTALQTFQNGIAMSGTQINGLPTATITGQPLTYGQTASGDLTGTYPNPYISTTLSGTIYNNQSNIAALSGSVSSISGTLSTTVNNVAALSGSVSSISGTLSTTVDNVVALSGSLALVSGNLVTTNSNVAALSGSVSSISGTLSTVISNVASLSGSLALVSGNLVTTNSNLAALSGSVSSISGTLSTTVTNVASLSGSLALVSGNLVTTNNNLAALSGSVSSISGALSTVSGVAYTTQSNLATLSGIAIISGYNAGGDLSGKFPSPTVAKIQGIPVLSTTPTNLQIMRYLTASGAWVPSTGNFQFPTTTKSGNYTAVPNDYVEVLATVAPITITLPPAPQNGSPVSVSSNLSSTYNVTVVASGSDTIAGGSSFVLPGTGVFNSASFIYDANNTQWLIQSNQFGDSAGGDLTGNYPNPTVYRIQGTDVSPTPPNTGQVLASVGGVWTPVTSSGLGTPGPGGAVGYWFAGYDTTNQTLTTVLSGKPILIGTPTDQNGIVSSASGTITIGYTGTYNFQFSVQFQNSDNAAHNANVWLRKNGANLAETNGTVAIPRTGGTGNGYTISSWNYIVAASGGDKFQFMWTADDTHVSIIDVAGLGTAPNSPGFIATVQQVMYNQTGTYTVNAVLASGNSQASATPLTLSTYAPVTGATASGNTLAGTGVVLGTPTYNGQWAQVHNQSTTGWLLVYPASGATIDQEAANGPIWIPPSAFWEGVATTTLSWDTKTQPITSTTINVSYEADGGQAAINLPSIGTPGTYGTASGVVVVTTDTQGRVSAATTTPIAISQSQVAGLVTLSGQVATNQSNISTLSGITYTNQTNIAALSGSLALVSGNLVTTNSNVAALSGSLALVSGNLVTTNSNLAALSGSVSSISGTLSTTVSSVAALSGSLALVSGNLVTTNSNLAALSGSVSSISGTLSTTVSNVAALSGSLALVSGNLVTTNSNLAALSGSVSSISGSLSTTVTNVTALSGSLALVSGNLVTTNSNVTALSGSLALVSGNLVTTNSNLSTLSGQVATTISNLAALSGSVSSISGSLVNTNSYVAALSGSLALVSGNLVTTNSNLAALSGSVASISGALVVVSGVAFAASGVAYNALPKTGGTVGPLVVSGSLTVSGTTTLSGALNIYSSTVGGVVATSGQALVYSGGQWVPGAVSATSTPFATVNLTGQSAAISATTLFNAPTSGLYQINYYGKVTVSGSTSSVLGPLNIISTDPDGNVVTTLGQSTSNNSVISGFINDSVQVFALSGTNVQYTNAYSSSGGTAMQYNLHIAAIGMTSASGTNSTVSSTYASTTLTAQSGALSSITLYTAPTAGLYTINYYGKVTTAATTNSVLGPFTVTSTDPDGNTVSTVGLLTTQNSVSTGVINGSITVYVGSGTNIQYSVPYTSNGATAMKYSIYATVGGTTANTTVSGVSSFNGRSGAVSPAVGDYSGFWYPDMLMLGNM